MIRLGLRLARAGGPVRAVSLLLGGALGVALLGLAWGLPDALYPRYEDPLTPGVWVVPPQRGSAVAMSALMLAPVLMLLLATGRLSAVIRDQRLVSLRLIGVSKARTLVAAAVENVSITLVGALVGLGLFAGGAWIVNTRLPVEQPLALSVVQFVVLVVGVVEVAALLALASTRTLELLPTQARRGGIARKASWWRAVPVVVALACFGVIIADVSTIRGNVMAALFLAGVGVGALGIATAPALVARYSAAALRRSRRFPLVMAGRGIDADPTSATRRVASVGVGIFAIFVTAGVMNAWESVPQSRYATFNAERGPQEVKVLSSWTENSAPPITDADITALAAVPGVEHVIRNYPLESAECDEETGTGCYFAFVGTCEQLGTYLSIAGCSDERAAWLDTTDRSAGRDDGMEARSQTLELRGRWPGDDATEHTSDPFTVQLSEAPIKVDWSQAQASRGYPPDFDLFVPEHLIVDLDLPVRTVDVIGPPGRPFVDSIDLVAKDRGLETAAWSYLDYSTLLSVRTMLGSAGAALVTVIVLVVTLSVLDWLRESRRPRMRQLAIGVPRGVIARTYLVQFGIPLIGAVILGALLGGAGLRAYEVMGNDVETVGTFNLPPTYWWLAAALVVGVLTATGLAGLAARERMRPEDLRQE